MKKFFTILFVASSFFCGAQSKTVVISEVYGGGGAVNSSYKNDYIQLFNFSPTPVDLSGYTLQIAPAANGSWSVVNLSGVIPANHWFLIKGKGNPSSGADLPVADFTGDFDIRSESGKIALVNSGNVLTADCAIPSENVIDFIGYGKDADCSETSPAPAHTVVLATSRINFATDANDNASDFTVFPPNARNTLEIALPITLNVFSVNKVDKANNIHWQVNCLSTSVIFQIERSPSLQNFTPIYSSNETKSRCATPFDIKDNSPLGGENYYRLKITDIDGHVSYSKISRSVNDNNNEAHLKITPNIVSSFAEFHYNSDKVQNIQIQVLDIQGRMVKKLSFQAITGDNKIPVETAAFAKGQYRAFIFANGEKSKTAKFVKQ
ncbi:MAG: lamin tail domain-containing protein [Ginsengibacter sp.]